MDIDLKRQLNGYGISLKKAYGQNFISDGDLLNNIVTLSGVTKLDTVLEIGCGAGTLTNVLCKNAKRVVGYEIDKTLQPILSKVQNDNDNLEIVYGDIMKEKLSVIEEKLREDYIIVANLPYYITTPVIMKFLENSKQCKGMVIMVQEEVADRFCAKSGCTDYGAITVAINLRGHAEKILTVGREKFTPQPKVDSAVIKITVDLNKYSDEELSKTREVVRIAFSSRRKMLINNLINFYKISRENASRILIDSKIKLTARAEELSAEQYVKLSEVITDFKKR